VTRISSPPCGSASTAIERARLTSRLANAAAVIAGASDTGRSQLLQVIQFQHRVGVLVLKLGTRSFRRQCRAFASRSF
jgi:hypothetical protein